MTTQLFRSLATLSFGFIGCLCLASHAHAQGPAVAGYGSGQPIVIHVHHHYSTALPEHMMKLPQTASTFIQRNIPEQQQIAWQYGNQSQMGAFYQPWNQNWGHLGFTGYLGQHGGGVTVTLQTVSGLVVQTVTPGSAAAKMGLVVGDIITQINDTPVDSYKRIAVLFEETRENPKHDIEMTVWNPHTRRTSTIKAILKGD